MAPYSLFRRFVSLLLAVLVLTASVGLTVQRHTCRITGRSKVGMSVTGQANQLGCGSQLAPVAPSAKDNCCDFSSHLHKLSVPAHQLAGKVLVPSPPLLAIWMAPMVWSMKLVVPAVVAAAPQWFAADSSPPPLGGRVLLAFVCTLVV
ncbi:MAG: hypothetical protein JWR44_3288 [Hymenobacter sp.]|jgi:hypothetical protein|nr:hypothetical protein [Hymenobacter sp.]